MDGPMHTQLCVLVSPCCANNLKLCSTIEIPAKDTYGQIDSFSKLSFSHGRTMATMVNNGVMGTIILLQQWGDWCANTTVMENEPVSQNRISPN